MAGLAAVTRFPDGRSVRRVAKAPVIGPWIERLADLYREPPAAEEVFDLEGGVDVIYRIDLERHEAVPTIQVEGGSVLFAEASEGSRQLASLPATRVELLDRRGDWYQVEYGDQKGWVLLPNPQ